MEAQSVEFDTVSHRDVAPCNTIETTDSRTDESGLTTDDLATNTTGTTQASDDTLVPGSSEEFVPWPLRDPNRKYSSREEYLSAMLPYPTETYLWSRSTHEAIISHLLAYPLELDPSSRTFPRTESFSGNYAQADSELIDSDHEFADEPYIIFELYFDFYSSHWILPSDHPVRGKLLNRNCPPQFRQIIEDCTLFYLNTLYPFTTNPFGQKCRNHRSWIRLSHILRDLGGPMLNFRTFRDYDRDERSYFQIRQYELEPPLIWKRYDSGLMREQQIQLLILVVRTMMDRIRLLCHTANSQIEFMKLEDWTRTMMQIDLELIRTNRSIHIFFGNERFRSERLELLLTKYLLEDDINMEVVKGLESAQRIDEDNECNAYRTKAPPDPAAGTWSIYEAEWDVYCEIAGIENELRVENPIKNLSDILYK